ncbi:MAG TPA: DUF1127 domain-containing protein [Amaricoccus sp.]|uniref:DUF1127 domain-containing protein n=1 Tax=Amaricoccus sp. TaxID=1872485 RepID=UPI002BAB761A|nr:DUF1127 domain-containing protein [Amaricoccus sp.]HMQ91934.1 DUF1127 domain-containing protein [Amaricoccus sp.]HMR51575.1 DUF1127 domain-containing protein [Amaricoccus sp.]HMR59041.1 DUF1127 domain-containing protein [Amaricoccus sp.]HMT98551.1 DUF1127 domain-containing protein [Amaricoccus sp.]
MAYPEIRTAPPPGFAALASTLARRWRARSAAGRARRALRGLSDASLRDIGLERHQIEPLAPEWRWPL